MIRPRQHLWPLFSINPLPLFLNHIDAWGVTAVIVSAALTVHNAVSARGLLLLALVTTTYWFGFALNDYFDVPVDRLDAQKARRNFFVRYALPRGITAVFAILVTSGLLLGYSQFGSRGLLVVLLGFPIAWAYSAPPVRLKSVPFLDVVTHALFVQTFPYIVTLFLLHIPWQTVDYLVITAFILTSLSSQFEQQVRDFACDSQLEQNFTTRFGLSWSQNLIRICSGLVFLLFAFGFVLQVIPVLYLPLALITLPLLVHRFLYPEQTRPRIMVVVLTIMGLLYTCALVGFHVLQ